jgi:hypothetical protein
MNSGIMRQILHMDREATPIDTFENGETEDGPTRLTNMLPSAATSQTGNR